MQLSIITITYNNYEGLKRTFQSVFAQTYRDFEYIIIDGASTDGSVEIIRASALQARGLSVQWISEPDRGVYDAMNKGIEIALGFREVDAFNRSKPCGDKNKGVNRSEHREDKNKEKPEYLLFLNAGDVLANDGVLEELAANDLTADIVSCNAIYEKSQYQSERYILSPKDIKASDLILGFLPHQATLIRRELFTRIHLYDTSFKVVSDWLFFIEALLKYNASYQHVQMFLSRCETEGMSSNPENNPLMDEEFHRGLKQVLPLYYEDYAKIRAGRMIGNKERDKFMHKLSLSWFGCVLWKLRNVLKCLGYYNHKHNYSRYRFYQQLQKEDNALKREIVSKIEALSEDMLLRQNNEKDVVVSLTSYGKRVSDTAPYAIYSIFTQSVLPNRIVLWLDREHWNDDNIPRLLKRLKQSGLEIYYCEDIRSYKKLIPSLKMFPHNPIVVIDDDFYYHKDFVKWMIEAYEQSDKRTVFATWGCIPEKVNEKYLPYSQWKDCKYGNEHTEYSLFGGGSIYPPHIFDDEVQNEKVFIKLCPTADDIWFWAHEKRLRIKTSLTEHHGYGLHRMVNRIEEYDLTQTGTLFYQNCVQGKNDEQLNNVLEYYHIG